MRPATVNRLLHHASLPARGARARVAGGATHALLAVAGLSVLVGGAACSGANNGYGGKTAPPAAAATQLAAAPPATSASLAPLSGVATPVAPAAVATPSGASTPATTAAAPATPSPAAAPLAVSIAGFAFAPATLHVPVGGSVTWTNKDAVTHTVTPDAGGIDAHELPVGAGFSQTFDTPGTYAYHCAIHPFMKGTIIVGS